MAASVAGEQPCQLGTSPAATECSSGEGVSAVTAAPCAAADAVPGRARRGHAAAELRQAKLKFEAVPDRGPQLLTSADEGTGQMRASSSRPQRQACEWAASKRLRANCGVLGHAFAYDRTRAGAQPDAVRCCSIASRLPGGPAESKKKARLSPPASAEGRRSERRQQQLQQATLTFAAAEAAPVDIASATRASDVMVERDGVDGCEDSVVRDAYICSTEMEAALDNATFRQQAAASRSCGLGKGQALPCYLHAAVISLDLRASRRDFYEGYKLYCYSYSQSDSHWCCFLACTMGQVICSVFDVCPAAERWGPRFDKAVQKGQGMMKDYLRARQGGASLMLLALIQEFDDEASLAETEDGRQLLEQAKDEVDGERAAKVLVRPLPPQLEPATALSAIVGLQRSLAAVSTRMEKLQVEAAAASAATCNDVGTSVAPLKLLGQARQAATVAPRAGPRAAFACKARSQALPHADVSASASWSPPRAPSAMKSWSPPRAPPASKLWSMSVPLTEKSWPPIENPALPSGDLLFRSWAALRPGQSVSDMEAALAEEVATL
eukprot:SM000034S12681  [mRNA]  locus=s34:130896:133146:- [translate_table: standard]